MAPAVDCRAHHYRSRAQKETGAFPRRRVASRGDLGARRPKNRSARKQSVSEVLHIGRDEGDEIQGAAVKKVRRRSSASEVYGTLVLADGAIFATGYLGFPKRDFSSGVPSSPLSLLRPHFSAPQGINHPNITYFCVVRKCVC
jgi:hypothetical protein